MKKKVIFPIKIEEKNAYFKTVVLYIEENATRLKVSPEDVIDSGKALDDWNDWFGQWQNENLRNKTIVANKDAAAENLTTILKRIYGDIPQSVLTADDKTTFNIEEASTTRTPTPVPTTFPLGKVNNNIRLEHTISFTNQDGKHGKPEGVRGCQVWCKEGEPVLSIKELRFLGTDTASPYLVKFDVTDVGKTFHYWLRWENTRGETGPWSTVISAIVAG